MPQKRIASPATRKNALFKGLPVGEEMNDLSIMEMVNILKQGEEPEKKKQDTIRDWIKRSWMMGGGTDWDRVEALYVRNPQAIPLERFAQVLGLSLATVRAHANRREWTRRRAEFHRQFGERVIDRLAHDQAAYIRAGLYWYRQFALLARNHLMRAMASLEIRTMREAMEVADRLIAIDKAMGVLDTETIQRMQAVDGEAREIASDMDYAGMLDKLDKAREAILKELEAAQHYDRDTGLPALSSGEGDEYFADSIGTEESVDIDAESV